ncbi:MAG: aspartate kinase [Oscillospiraceae bacterium]|jgi:aspartate kinase|nr:aspartate kinase [Oscillospiraceae bacterium]
MALIVQKFGGSSVCSTERLFAAADIITKKYSEGNNVIVVVSAQGKTTDELIKKARKINKQGSGREMDVLLSTGEQISVALLAMAIQKLGFPAVSLLGWQAGFKTDSNYGSAKIKKLLAIRIMQEIKKNNIAVIAGFQGVNDAGDITTFERGGSDISAVAIAAVVNAAVCQIYTDVDGVYDSNPKFSSNARKYTSISYENMLKLASSGAKVLNCKSVEMAKRHNVKLEVLSSFEDLPGTIIE